MTAEGREEYEPPAALWSLAFRPFFLAAALWAALALALWIELFLTGGTLPSRFEPLAWHIHAMLFGFMPAAIAGFMLTAIATWTGRPPIRGARLFVLAVLWLFGRIVCLISAAMPLWLSAVIDLAFPVALCVVAAHEIVAARNWRNLMMPLPIGLLAVANLLAYLELAQFNVPAGLWWRLATAAIIALITAIGGRIIPAFTRNWLVKHQSSSLPAAHGLMNTASLATLHAGLVGWALMPAFWPLGILLLIAALLNLDMLARWRGWATRSEPLLAILHVGYGWVVLGTALLGASLLSNSVPEAAAIHAYTAGAIGTMILAVMSRVSLGHTGRPLEADRGTTTIYLAITLAAVIRVAAPFAHGFYLTLLEVSALLWIASFLAFGWKYVPILTSPRIARASGSS
ncbi:NnrS family protein [Gluconobacter oxydans]|uniref:NnrS family protein n=1 Tax=Gluconobacter oxydans TaxID=442 RepID=UPI003464610D